MLNRAKSAINDSWQSFLKMIDPVIKAMSNLWQAFTKKINPVIAKIEATTLGGPLVRGSRNVGNSLYHLGSALKHILTGVLSLAKLFFKCFKYLFGAGAVAFLLIATSTLAIIVKTSIDVFTSLKASAKALFGIKEKNASAQETALTTQNSQEDYELLDGELSSHRDINNVAVTAEQRYEEERIRLQIISDAAFQKMGEGFNNIIASEKILANRSITPDQVEHQEEILKDVLLNEIYKPGREIVMQFVSALTAGLVATSARRDNSRTEIQQLPDNGVIFTPGAIRGIPDGQLNRQLRLQ